MADTKISDLGAGGNIQDGDEFVIARSGANAKITGAAIASKAPVQSVNSLTGAAVLDPDDLDDSTTTNKFASTANVDAAGAVMESDYNAHTVLAATADNTPAPVTVSEQTLVGRITSGNITALTATQVRTLLNVEDGADVTDATNVDTAGAVMESDYNANTILAATADNTPAALTVAEQTLVGRITSGAIDALTATEVRTLLNVEDGADATDATNVAAAGAIMDGDFSSNGLMKRTGAGTYATATADTDYQSVPSEGAFADGDKTKLDGIETAADVTDATNVDAAGAVMESDYNANTILAATADNTPAAVTVAEQTLVGRITSGNITALTAAQVRTLLNVADGAEANVIEEVADDTSPTLGGDLDGDGNTISNFENAYNNQTGTTYTVVAGDRGKIVTFNNASAVTVTLPNNMPIGWSIVAIQLGAGAVGFSAGSGATLNNRQSHASLAGQYAMATLTVYANSDGSSAVYALAGDTDT